MKKIKYDDWLTEDEVKITAELAAIELDEHSLSELTKSLRVVLQHFEVISKIDVNSNVCSSPIEKWVDMDKLRDDTPRTIDIGPVVRNAPDFEDGYFFVPRILR